MIQKINKRHYPSFDKFKKTGSVNDYLKYIDEKKKDMEASMEKIDGVKRRNNYKDN